MIFVFKCEWLGFVFVDFRYDELCVYFIILIYLFMFCDFFLVVIGSGCILKVVDDDSMVVFSIGWGVVYWLFVFVIF